MAPPLNRTSVAAHSSLQPSIVIAGLVRTRRHASSSPSTSFDSATRLVLSGRSASQAS
jgi:hypothetical protein